MPDPQTVSSEIFLWIERRIEGVRSARIRLDAAPWSAAKLARKSGKHAAWIAVALFTGFSFVGYFTPVRTLLVNWRASRSGRGRASGCCSTARPPTATPASCASRSASTGAIRAMKARVAELEYRLEISPLHNVDGIMARDATIKLQDDRIFELERRLREAEGRVAELESELRDDHWPHGATVKLRWVGSGYCEKHGWAKRGAEGQLITVCSGASLDESMWEVVQELKVQPARGRVRSCATAANRSTRPSIAGPNA